jgi:REP element-mobilizing transposase RayT
MWEGRQCPDFFVRSDAHSRNLRLHRLSDMPATFFITKSLHPKKPVLDEEAREIIVSAFTFAVQQQRIHLRAFVVMPDHWHALFALREPWTLRKFMHAFMSYVAGETCRLLQLHGTHWQDGYYDTRVKTSKQFEFVTNYIERNPVVKGLVEKPDEWDASSARRRDLVTDQWPWLLDEY